MATIEDISLIEENALQSLHNIQKINDLSAWRKKYLGKNGLITQCTREISNAPQKQRPQLGKVINKVKKDLSHQYSQKKQSLQTQSSSNGTPSLSEWFDVTAPGTKPETGHIHPITRMRKQAEDIFVNMGFSIYEAREIDDDYHAFESLNIPKQHPARDIWDTIWTENNNICTPHTSSMQNRILKKEKPPFRSIIYGRCFRFETLDATHEHTFNQIEGLCVDTDITLTDLIGTLKTFLSTFYNRDVQLRIQPSYFPFVEPGLEFMIDCAICKGNGTVDNKRCSTCKGGGWIELVPAGMIHPNVLRDADLDPETYQGFAWGLGLDRLVMIKYGIEDIRHFHSGDLRFIKQF